ncbi:hypothetical protein HKD37_18G050247 [Glycine soja]
MVHYACMFLLTSALKGSNDSQGSKSKVTVKWIRIKCNKQRGSIECNYYVIHWMSMILCFYYTMQYLTDSRPLEPEKINELHIQWARCYLRVKNETLDVQGI